MRRPTNSTHATLAANHNSVISQALFSYIRQSEFRPLSKRWTTAAAFYAAQQTTPTGVGSCPGPLFLAQLWVGLMQGVCDAQALTRSSRTAMPHPPDCTAPAAREIQSSGPMYRDAVPWSWCQGSSGCSSAVPRSAAAGVVVALDLIPARLRRIAFRGAQAVFGCLPLLPHARPGGRVGAHGVRSAAKPPKHAPQQPAAHDGALVSQTAHTTLFPSPRSQPGHPARPLSERRRSEPLRAARTTRRSSQGSLPKAWRAEAATVCSWCQGSCQRSSAAGSEAARRRERAGCQTRMADMTTKYKQTATRSPNSR